jgi:hypothetical protein
VPLTFAQIFAGQPADTSPVMFIRARTPACRAGAPRRFHRASHDEPVRCGRVHPPREGPGSARQPLDATRLQTPKLQCKSEQPALRSSRPNPKMMVTCLRVRARGGYRSALIGG